jgi:hypothetical protein
MVMWTRCCMPSPPGSPVLVAVAARALALCAARARHHADEHLKDVAPDGTDLAVP